MTEATVAAQIHQSLNVHGNFPAQIAFHGHFAQQTTQLIEFALAQFTNLGLVIDTCGIQQLTRLGFADTIDIGKRDQRMFVVRNVYTG